MKRFTTAIASPIGVIFSAIGLTADKTWCIFFLVLSIILIIGSIIFLLISKIQQQRDIKHEVIAFYSFCIILLAVASNNLYSINRETDEFNQWINEVESLELKRNAKDEALLKRNNFKEICSEGIRYLYGTNGYHTDIPKAKKFFMHASYNSYPSAHIYLGDMHRMGIGQQKDPDGAYNLYLKAVKEGYLDGVYHIERIAEEYDHLKTKKDNDLKFFYAHEEEQNRIIKEVNSTPGANKISWTDKFTPSQLTTLERLSDEGYIYANKLLVACYSGGRDKQKAKKYATRLYEYGYISELPHEQFLMLSNMGVISGNLTNSYIYELSLKYDFYMSLMIPDFLEPLKDMFKDYDYCKRQYHSCLNLSNKYPDISTLHIIQHDEALVDSYLSESKKMLNKAIDRIERHIQTLYE